MTAIREAIILAGGKGTRLQSVVADLPKPMATVAGVPFLEHLFRHICAQGIEHIVLSVGYKAETIRSYFGAEWNGVPISYATETSPLGTGGAIAFALKFCRENDVLVFNGDTFFNIDLNSFYGFHSERKSVFTMALKEMINPDRYGTVELSETRIVKFHEKRTGLEKGLINSGVYALNKVKFLELPLGEMFSFEQDFLEPYVSKWHFNAFLADGYFIDIGIPEDYYKARARFALPSCSGKWTLFLDRDGVLNRRKIDDYVRSVEEFEFLPGVLEALKDANSIFGRIVVVTNQQGVGKGLMTEQDLNRIHSFMKNEVERAGGRIDAIYTCTALAAAKDPCRKPNTGMGLQARSEFPEIEFERSLMIGDSISDLEFAQNLNMPCVYITGEPYKNELNLTDVQAINLFEIVSYLKEQQKSAFSTDKRSVT
ncbi:MAG: HAD-IIIA family hydrolase [Flavobacteriales bacterium]|nr:HAD-IIIA family hydrolase [Flavobacteriales bacterium]